MNVMVFFEFSATVRDAFRSEGHNAWSLDILPTEGDHNYHIVADARDYVERYGWNTPNGKPIDLAVFHPPCQYLANSGARWLYKKDKSRDEDRWGKMREAAELFQWCLDSPVPMSCVENPIQIGHAGLPKYTQVVQPFEYGHGETKATCLWLKGLPLLEPTDVVDGREARIHKMPPSPDRWKDRSRTYPGIAKAMASQWG